MEKLHETPILEACAIAGGQAAMAKHLKVTPSVIQQWIRGTRPIALHHCPTIEKLTGVRCEVLNSKLDWAWLRGTSSKPAS